MPFGALYLLLKLRRVHLARDVLALLAPYLVVEEHEGVLQLAEARARAPGGLVREDEVCVESDRADFQLAHLALEGEQTRALFGDGRSARRDQLAADDALAARRHAHLARRQRQEHRLFESVGHARVHLARQRARENRADLARRSEQIRDAHVRADFNLNSVGYGVHSARDGTRSAGRGVNFVSVGIHFIVDGVSFVGERRAAGRVFGVVYFGSAVQTGDEERCAACARRL